MAVLILHVQLVYFDMKSLELCMSYQESDFTAVCVQEEKKMVAFWKEASLEFFSPGIPN